MEDGAAPAFGHAEVVMVATGISAILSDIVKAGVVINRPQDERTAARALILFMMTEGGRPLEWLTEGMVTSGAEIIVSRSASPDMATVSEGRGAFREAVDGMREVILAARRAGYGFSADGEGMVRLVLSLAAAPDGAPPSWIGRDDIAEGVSALRGAMGHDPAPEPADTSPERADLNLTLPLKTWFLYVLSAAFIVFGVVSAWVFSVTRSLPAAGFGVLTCVIASVLIAEAFRRRDE